ncbi:MAG: glycosyltransferase family protein [candidate division Zixibacteria bacterium]|nr:glycosyltransferase family protein [candidate division Zixibacteria bacterium]MDH3938050.1 glycosyltransferase family protein [candidate division Zixibacteria bacterium]MDH4033939.1 glycosyltransferase family protein [candidate division Zixibacteria bacterium]
MVLAVVQARVSSTRLPGKVLKPILGRPMLWRQLERLQHASRIDRLMVATSDQPDDRQLLAICADFDVPCFCGSLDDVLDRIYRAAQSVGADTIVRLTGDCPIIDAEVVDIVIDQFQKSACDYATNTNPPTYPDGLDVEVMGIDCLETAWREAKLISEREHVTPFIRNRPERFGITNCTNEADLSHLRWTVDEPEDFDLITRIFEGLYPKKPTFSMADVVEYLEDHPQLSKLNSGFRRNEGLNKSLTHDKTKGCL